MHQHFGRRGAGGDADAYLAFQPGRIDLRGIVDHVSRRALLLGHFAQAVGIGTVRAADDDHQVHLRRHELDGLLAVGGGVADVALFRLDNGRVFQLQGGDDVGRVVDRQGGLRYIRQHVRLSDVERGDVGHRFNQIHALLRLAHRAFDFGMAVVADHDDFAALAAHLGHFDVDLGDQRASRIENAQAARFRLGPHRLRHSVRGKHQRIAGRYIVEVFDEDRALVAQVFHHIGVVDDFVAHINRRAELLQRALDDFDRAVDAGAESTRLGQQNFLIHYYPRAYSTEIRFTSKRSVWPAKG